MRCLTFLLFAIAAAPFASAADPLPLRSGDRVVLIGDGFIEQEQYSGWVEVMLTTAFPDADVSFRNLGWNGDTPGGASRTGLSLVQAGREPAGEGWRQLQTQIELTKPTVAILGYGMANVLEASRGAPADKEASLNQFASELDRLGAKLQEVTPDCRFIVLSPIRPVGDSNIDDQAFESVCATLEKFATSGRGVYVDLTSAAADASQRKDAVHPNGNGYRAIATAMQTSLGLTTRGWEQSPHTESLRQTILEKNRYWFHRSRPANMAYVFGFRKREQGQNAVEIPQFDPLIAKEEERIAKLRALKSPQGSEAEPQLKSKYAEFTQQAKPEFVVADELEVTLWAENPLLNKPIHMNFDAQGRLWVASSEAYPMIEVGQSLPDKIIVLEDTNGDGKANDSRVFADGLLIPTGVVPGDGGVYVAQSTDLLFLKDTDGDGTADERTRVLSGFGTEDTHHNLHTLLFGPDGRLYMNQSVYTRTDAETPYGVVRLKAGGGFRLDTRRMAMDIFFHGLWNPWGHQFDAYGNSFMTDGAGFAGIAYVFPGATFNPTPDARRILDLISPGNYPKFCGGEIVRGESFPEDWQDTFVTCDFRANRVTRFSLSESESGFVTTQEADLIRTSESTFRPIDVKQGPDGALYIADWSNPIINHGEVDFRDPRRDRWHGRIWRVAFKDRPSRKVVDLNKLSIEQLFGHLTSGDRYLCDQARRVLIDRGKETKSQLDQLWQQCESPVDQLNATRLSASVDSPRRDWLNVLLESEDGNARAAATRILADWSDPARPETLVGHDEAHEKLGKRVVDAGARARLEAIRGLASLGGIDSIRLSLAALDHPMDRFIEHALFLNVETHADALIADLEDPWWSQRQSQLEFVLTAVAPEKATRFLGGYLAREGIAADGKGPWIDLIAKAGGPGEAKLLLDHLIGDKLNGPARAAALSALADAKQRRKVMPPMEKKPVAALKRWMGDVDPGVQSAALRLVGAWQVRFLLPQLAELAGEDKPIGTRLAAIDAIRACGGGAAATALNGLAEASNPPDVQSALITALARVDAAQAIAPFYEAVAAVEDENQALALWRALLSTKGGEARLVAALPKDGVPQVAARAGIRAAKEGGRDAQSLVDALMPLSGLTMTAADWTPQRAAEIRRLVAIRGDAARGELVYRRSQLQCVNCHAVGGVGGKVGPDLTSLGTGAPIDYIIESLYDPNAKIKENYHSITVLTDSGQVFSGIQQQGSGDELVLRDASNKVIRVSEDEILETKQGPSLMPANLLDRISQGDQLDLIRFLTKLGRPGEYDASRQNVARVVEVFAGTHRVEQAGVDDVIAGTREAGWKQLMSRVSGKIEREPLQQATLPPRNISLVNIYVKTSVELASKSNVRFAIDNIKSASCWVDGGEEHALGEAIEILPGKHTVVFRIDGRDLPESITIRSADVTFVSEE